MSDETEAGSARGADRGRHPAGGDGFSSPLQARAAFLKNWDWQSIISINRGACERGGAQQGANSETHTACSEEWETQRSQPLTLGEALDFLRSFHKQAPFLFYNGNTFATIGRELCLALFSEVPPTRRREVSSAVGHYIAGVLDRESMTQALNELCRSASFQVGDRVKTFRGGAHGRIVRLLEDGRVVWRLDGSGSELIALPESLLSDK